MSAAQKLAGKLFAADDRQGLTDMVLYGSKLLAALDGTASPKADKAKTGAQRTAEWRAKNAVTRDDSNVTCDSAGDVTSDENTVTCDVTVTSLSRASLSLSSSVDSGITEESTDPEGENAREARAQVSARKADEDAVFAHWVAGWLRVVGGTRKPVHDAKRRARIRARRAEGHSVADLCKACDGLWMSEWHVREGHTDILVALRDDAQTLKFIAIAEGKVSGKDRPAGKPSTLQGHTTEAELFAPYAYGRTA